MRVGQLNDIPGAVFRVYGPLESPLERFEHTTWSPYGQWRGF